MTDASGKQPLGWGLAWGLARGVVAFPPAPVAQVVPASDASISLPSAICVSYKHSVTLNVSSYPEHEVCILPVVLVRLFCWHQSATFTGGGQRPA